MKNRVAAIVIHGIGEQKPMSTMSDFVKSFLAYEEYKGYIKPEQNYYSSPEEIEGSFETQRWIVMPTKYLGKKNPDADPYHSDNYIPIEKDGKSRPMTDFYELYWAPLMNDNKFSHVIPWLINLIKSENKPPGIMSLLRMAFIAAIILFLLAVFSSIGIYDLVTRFDGLPLMSRYLSDAILTIGIMLVGNLLIKVTKWLLVPAIIIIISLSFYAIWLLFHTDQNIFLYVYWGLFFSIVINSVFYKFSGRLLKDWLADAARYFSPTPDNIAQRDAIRNKGVELLETLTKKDKYDRIVVIGHSLGSAVGYDILRLYWAKHNKFYQMEENVETILQQMDFIDDFNESQLKEYQKSQHEGFNFLKHNNIDTSDEDSPYLPWLVSDFITLGSPLSKFTFLLSDGNKEKEWTAINERTMVTNPPVKDSVTESYYYQHSDGPRFHHGALFAFTRWTNIFHENDHIGGALDSALGKGNINQRIHAPVINKAHDKKMNVLKRFIKYLTSKSVAMHTHYWASVPRDISKGFSMGNPIVEEAFEADLAFDSIEKIYDAMHFDGK